MHKANLADGTRLSFSVDNLGVVGEIIDGAYLLFFS